MLIPYEETYCPKHKEMYIQYKHRQYKNRDKTIKADIEEDKLKQFYKSIEWIKTREYAIQSLLHMDIVELYRTGRVIQGQTVHHIVEIRDDWTKRLDVSNLIYLTESNHRHIHNLYDKDRCTKEQTQKMLQGLLLRFKQDYI